VASSDFGAGVGPKAAGAVLGAVDAAEAPACVCLCYVCVCVWLCVCVCVCVCLSVCLFLSLALSRTCVRARSLYLSLAVDSVEAPVFVNAEPELGVAGAPKPPTFEGALAPNTLGASVSRPCVPCDVRVLPFEVCTHDYEVASVSRIDKITRLFCRISSLL